MYEHIENHFQTIISLFNKLISIRRKIKKFKLRCESNLSSFQQRYLTKTTNIIFEIENMSRLKLSSFFKIL